MGDLEEIRRRNLEIAVAEIGGNAKLGAKLGHRRSGKNSGAYIWQLINGRRTISEKSARQWEKALHKPPNWFDVPRADAPGSANGPAVNSVLLAQVLAEVMRALELGIPVQELSDYVVAEYTDALAAGRANPDRIQVFAGLLKRMKRTAPK